MRVFFGISLPSHVGRALKGFTASIRDRLPRMKWVEPENLHITLKFLGDVDEGRIPPISSAAGRAASSMREFDVVLGTLGAFPNHRKARVVWWGLMKGAGECITLFNILEEKLEKSGFEKERKRYHPHITLARLRNPASLSLEDFAPPAGLSFTASSFTLYQSTLTPQGPIYKTIEEFEFG